MNIIPPDWKEDQKLWEMLGRLPRIKPPSNFAHMIHRKLEKKEVFSRKRESFLPVPIQSLFRGWLGGFVTATACFLLLISWIRHSPSPSSPRPSSAVIRSEKDKVKTAMLAQHYELIQDLEMIEHLDEF